MMEQEIGDNEIGGGSVKKVYVESLERDTIFSNLACLEDLISA